MNINKEDISKIRINTYNYILPEEKVAKFPLEKRDESRLLIYQKGNISEKQFKNIDEYIPENSLLVFNNTKVIQARLIFQKETGAQVEIFCLEPKIPADYAQVFVQNQTCTWLCMIGNLKKWKEGRLFKSIPKNHSESVVSVEKLESYGETHLIRFEWNNPNLSFAEILECCGELPIPPYLNRKTEEQDKQSYQTIYSKIKGSVAAPTAGLHFTPEVFDSLTKKQVDIEELTLHVGAGTFKPVKTDTIENHLMHTECITITRSILEKIIARPGKIYAVGTTSVRTLESLYYIGNVLYFHPEASIHELEISQWMPYEEKYNRLSVEEALKNILAYFNDNKLDRLTTYTQIMIVPGYQFRIVKGIITNFHQPQSTLLLLISAFVGEDWKKIYDYALEHQFRFLSYGDSSILL